MMPLTDIDSEREPDGYIIHYVGSARFKRYMQLMDLGLHARGLTLDELAGMREAKELWCCEDSPRVVRWWKRLLQASGIYRRATRRHLNTLLQQGRIRLRPATATRAARFVLTRAGHRWLDDEQRSIFEPVYSLA